MKIKGAPGLHDHDFSKDYWMHAPAQSSVLSRYAGTQAAYSRRAAEVEEALRVPTLQEAATMNKADFEHWWVELSATLRGTSEAALIKTPLWFHAWNWADDLAFLVNWTSVEWSKEYVTCAYAPDGEDSPQMSLKGWLLPTPKATQKLFQRARKHLQRAVNEQSDLHAALFFRDAVVSHKLGRGNAGNALVVSNALAHLTHGPRHSVNDRLDLIAMAGNDRDFLLAWWDRSRVDSSGNM